MPILDRAQAGEMAQRYRSRYNHMASSGCVEDLAYAPAYLFAADVWRQLMDDLAERSAIQGSLDRRVAWGGNSAGAPDPEAIAVASYPERLRARWIEFCETYILPDDGPLATDIDPVGGSADLVRADGQPVAPEGPPARLRRLLDEDLRPYVHPRYIDAFVDEMKTILRVRDEDLDDASTVHRLQRPAAAHGFEYAPTQLPPVRPSGAEGPPARSIQEDGTLRAADAIALGLCVAAPQEIEQAARRPKQRQPWEHRLIGPEDQAPNPDNPPPSADPARAAGRAGKTATAGAHKS